MPCKPVEGKVMSNEFTRPPFSGREHQIGTTHTFTPQAVVGRPPLRHPVPPTMALYLPFKRGSVVPLRGMMQFHLCQKQQN